MLQAPNERSTRLWKDLRGEKRIAVQFASSQKGDFCVKLSARNQLSGVVTSTTLGSVMAEVSVKIDAGAVVAAITRSSVEALDLKAGDKVTVVIKSTEVMIAK
jgi:molybdopterin-binding protein